MAILKRFAGINTPLNAGFCGGAISTALRSTTYFHVGNLPPVDSFFTVIRKILDITGSIPIGWSDRPNAITELVAFPLRQIAQHRFRWR